jgi:enamine deaminase RidA (YjgF/YER057c/UK114 family)
MSTITRIEPGIRSSRVVIHAGTMYLSGQVGNAEDNIAQQTQTCLDKVEAILTENGSDREHLLQTTIWLRDMSDFAAMNEVWNAWVPEGHAPARACGEAKLAREALLVEIIVTAAVKG